MHGRVCVCSVFGCDANEFIWNGLALISENSFIYEQKCHTSHCSPRFIYSGYISVPFRRLLRRLNMFPLNYKIPAARLSRYGKWQSNDDLIVGQYGALRTQCTDGINKMMCLHFSIWICRCSDHFQQPIGPSECVGSALHFRMLISGNLCDETKKLFLWNACSSSYIIKWACIFVEWATARMGEY